MTSLNITLFGLVTISHETTQTKLTRSLQLLLAFLVLHRHRTYSRDLLAGLFWGEQHQARANQCLSTAVWRLRRILEPEPVTRGSYLITSPAGEIGFNGRGNYWLDVASFQSQVDRVLARGSDAMDDETATLLEEVLELYTGDLLEGFYEDWVVTEREGLRNSYINALACLMHHCARRGRCDEAIGHGKRILELDSLREDVHRAMMILYADSGRRALAARQYDTCRRLLNEELGVSPMEETEELHQRLFPTRLPARVGGSANPEVISSQLAAIMEDLQRVQRRLQVAMRLTEGFLEEDSRETMMFKRSLAG